MKTRTRKIKRSGFEDKIAADLDKRGIVYEYEQHKLEYSTKVPGGFAKCTNGRSILSLACELEIFKRKSYLPDFLIKRGRRGAKDLWIEAKGRLTGPDRTKLIAVKKQHPRKDIRILFYRKEKINLKDTPYNTDWAEKHGFKYAIGHEVPKDWL